MEVLLAAGLTGLAALVLAMVVRSRDGRLSGYALVYVWLAQVAHLALYGADWGYGSGTTTPFQLIARGHLALLVPLVPAAAIALLLPAYRSRASGWVLALASLQGLSFIPVLLWVEQQTDMSFLSPAAIACLGLSASSALVSVPAWLSYGARPGSGLHRIAYRDRADLLRYLEEARGRWEAPAWIAPANLLDAGRLSGALEGRRIEIDTLASFHPFAYQVALRLDLKAPAPSWLVHRSDRAPPWPEAWALITTPDAWFAAAEQPLRALYMGEGVVEGGGARALAGEIGGALATLGAGSLWCDGVALRFVQRSRLGCHFDLGKERALLDLAARIEAGGPGGLTPAPPSPMIPS